MKILYAIQGTGNGHISRAREVAPILEERADVDYLISGCQVDLEFPFEVDYRVKGMSLIFGKSGGVNLGKTFRENVGITFRKEIRDLPVEKYDLVINDFEPISAWAARNKGVRCAALSHQSALRSQQIPRPSKNDPFGKAVLKHYAPADAHYGFHFSRYEQNIYTPIIRKEFRDVEISDEGHVTVYLPAYDDHKILNILYQIPEINWQVFSKHGTRKYLAKNVLIQPIDEQKFTRSMVSSHGVLCGAGFETPSEALFLGKKLMVIPMKNQYEQQCNAQALKEMGVSVIPKLSQSNLGEISRWINCDHSVHRNYPNETEHIVDVLLSREL